MKHYFANSQIKIQENMAEAYRNSYLHFIDPWAAVEVYRHTNTLSYTSLAHTHQGIKSTNIYIVCEHANWFCSYQVVVIWSSIHWLGPGILTWYWNACQGWEQAKKSHEGWASLQSQPQRDGCNDRWDLLVLRNCCDILVTCSSLFR